MPPFPLLRRAVPHGAVAVVFGGGTNDPASELDDPVLGPVAIARPAGVRDEGAMATVLGDDYGDVWISGDRRLAKGLRRDERIIGCRDDQRRHANAMHDPQCAGAIV